MGHLVGKEQRKGNKTKEKEDKKMGRRQGFQVSPCPLGDVEPRHGLYRKHVVFISALDKEVFGGKARAKIKGSHAGIRARRAHWASTCPILSDKCQQLSGKARY